MGRGQFIGLAASERRIDAAEVVSAHGRLTVARVGSFDLPDGVSWQHPSELGRRLGAFLREQGMTGPVVVGLPAAWLMAAACEVPPVDAEDLVPLLRLAKERTFSLLADEIACDYGSAPSAGEAGVALLVAARRDRVEAVSECVRAAGLKLRAVTGTAAALAAVGPRDAEVVTIYIAPEGIDVVLARGDQVLALRHVSVGAGRMPSVQTLLLGVQSALRAGTRGPAHVALWDGVGLADGIVREAGSRLGVAINREPAAPWGGLPADARGPTGCVAAAAALALVGLDGRVPFDLLAPRLAERAERRWRRHGVRAALVAAAVLVGAGALMLDRSERRSEVALLRAKLDELQPAVTAARGVVDAVSRARGWYDRRPPLMDCLMAITEAFPEQGRIWATSLGLREDMRGMVSGKAADEQSALEMLDAMKSSASFADVKLLYQEKRGASSEITFAATFAYMGTTPR